MGTLSLAVGFGAEPAKAPLAAPTIRTRGLCPRVRLEMISRTGCAGAVHLDTPLAQPEPAAKRAPLRFRPPLTELVNRSRARCGRASPGGRMRPLRVPARPSGS